jgi:transcriptional antiterminator RfaH
LFVRLDLSRHQWRAVNGVRGVVRMVIQGDAPVAVRPGIVEALQASTSADGALDWSPRFKIGQAIRIADGPFANFVGQLEHLDGSGRVHLLLDLLGRSVSVALHSKALIPAA